MSRSLSVLPRCEDYPKGHDPRRSNCSPATGPLHPHLLFTRDHFVAALVGADGGIYGTDTDSVDIVALDASGRQRWAITGCRLEGDPALAPDETLFDAGGLSPNHGDTGNGTAAMGIAPEGSVAWRIDPFGLPKGAVSLLTPDSAFYAPIIGPHNGTGSKPYIGLDVVSSAGSVLRMRRPSTSGCLVARMQRALPLPRKCRHHKLIDLVTGKTWDVSRLLRRPNGPGYGDPPIIGNGAVALVNDSRDYVWKLGFTPMGC